MALAAQSSSVRLYEHLPAHLLPYTHTFASPAPGQEFAPPEVIMGHTGNTHRVISKRRALRHQLGILDATFAGGKLEENANAPNRN